MNDAKKTLETKRVFKEELASRFPADVTEKIWTDATERLAAMYNAHLDLPKGVRTHTDSFIFPAAAIYLAVKEVSPDSAFEIMQKIMKEKASQSGVSLAKMTRHRLFAKFFLSMWNPVSHKMFGETAGFKNVFYPKKKGEFRMDITQCPYKTYLTEQGCPELTRLFCDNDVYSYGNLPNLTFTRTKTLGSGGALCDFHLALTK
ncbi:MAG: L-2-amino-thiazoline-4-carboxylic acid hydrolase [Treponema sp.]|nr:L-2-amino-thiazoline-4-carboxylic acid hydrolase [Treponema sp.]